MKSNRVIQTTKHQQILNFLNEASGSRFWARKWNIVNDQSKANYDKGNEIIYNTEVLKSRLCNYKNAYILVTGDITVLAVGEDGVTQVSLKNFVSFTACITKIYETTIDDAKNLDLTIPMHNLLECSWNYSDTTASLWFYYKDETTEFNADIENTDEFKSFK